MRCDCWDYGICQDSTCKEYDPCLVTMARFDDLEHDIDRTFDGQLKNIERLWDMILNEWE